MPKIAKELSALEVKRLTKAGMHAVGNPAGLLLQIHKPVRATSIPARSWILRIRIAGDRQHIGIGPYPTVALAEAREEAKKIVGSLRQGVNPKNEKKRKRSALIDAAAKNKTFKECAEAYIAAHSAEFSNEKHRKQWSATLESYAYPIIGDMLVADISMRNVLDVLKQDIKDPKTNKTLGAFWETKTTTASRLQGRIKTILDFAIVNEYRQGPNPGLWSGYLDTQLATPAKIKKVKHHPAIPYPQIGDFMVQLRKNESISAKALQFLILTAVRSGSVRSADWSEINLENKLWIIPAEHTKTKQEHRVPLSDQAIALLNSLPKLAVSAKIFPSLKGKSLSDMALSQLMRGMKERKEFNGDGVPHGFRSTFRDWGAEQTIYPDEIRKSASGHTVGNAVQKAYQRTDLLEKRRQLMIQWAKFLDKPSVNKTSKVKSIRSACMNIGYKSHSEIQLERFYHKHESAHLDGNQYEEFGRNLIEHVLRVERVKAEIPNNTPWRKRLLFNISTLQMLCMWTPPKEDLRIAKKVLKLNEEGNTDKANELLRKFISEYEKSISKTQTELGNIKKRKHPVIEIVETIYGENNNIMGKHIEGAIKDPRWKEMITIYGETIYPVDKRFGSRSLSGLPSLLSRVANKK